MTKVSIPAQPSGLFRIGLPDSAEVLFGPTLLTHLCAAAPGLRLRFYPTDGVFEALDADRLDLGIIFGPLPEGGSHHKRRTMGSDSYLCMFNAERVGVSPPISLEDYLRLPHVLTNQQAPAGGGGRSAGRQRAAAKGRADDGALRGGAVPRGGRPGHHHHACPAGALFRRRARTQPEPGPVKLRSPPVTLVWHASYDHDPAHVWLRGTVTRIATELGWDRAPE